MSSFRLNSFGIICAFALVISLPALAIHDFYAEDEIQSLPGLTHNVTFKHYSGYLQTTKAHFFHYWFVESESDPANDPLLFWFNGGPGCSSIGGGLLSELGPYFVNPDGKTLRKNPDSWKKFANVVFIESPAGVGHSYTTDGNLKTSDRQTSKENYEAIKLLMQKYPAFRNHSLFIAGESYGGIYIPTLAERILDGQEDFHTNFKGLAIGNGWVNRDLDTKTGEEFLYGHGIIDKDSSERMKSDCCEGNSCDFENFNETCKKKIMSFGKAELNLYDIYRPCESSNHEKTSWVPTWAMNLGNKPPRYGAVPCLNFTSVTDYLNMPDVKKALHIRDHLPEWEICNDHVNMLYEWQYPDVSDLINKAVSAKVRVLLYYGDTDTVCNFLLGQEFSKNLGYEQVERKSQWDFNGQVAGYKTTYENNITFTTILGVGHMAPQWKAPQMNYAIQKFLNNEPF